jgi:uncharacterized protein (TIGR02391 family)
MPAIHQMIQDADTLLALEPEELAPVMLQFIISGSAYSTGSSYPRPLKRGNVFASGNGTPGHGYPSKYIQKVNEALMAAWVWLEREGLLLPAPGQQDRDWVVVSERGKTLVSKENFEAYRHGMLFPRSTLHPAIASNTFALFLRGHYDTVVFEAFRAVEVAVREGGGFPASLFGLQLMRAAFGDKGPLTDYSTIIGEQEATGHLFAGAIGLFKNPTSHRAGTVSKPEDAVALVLFADYLLRLIERRVSGHTPAHA